MDKLVKLEVFSKRTGIDRRVAYIMIKRGMLRATKPVGGLKSGWYVLESEIDRILAGGNK